MAGETKLHLISRADIAKNGCWSAWDDPDEIAPMSRVKIQAELTNPLGVSEDEPVQIIGTLNGRVIGRLDLIAGRLECNGDEVPCLWGSALYVPPEFRSTLMGVKLILELQRLHDTVGASGPGSLAYPLYRSLRWFDIPLTRYVLMRRSRSVVERYVRPPMLARMATVAADAALVAHRAIFAAYRELRHRGLVAKRFESFPPELAALVRRRAPPIVGHRSPAWIDWLLRSSFEENVEFRRGLFLVFTRSGLLGGYFIVKSRLYESATQSEFKNLHLGSLQDWMIFDSKTLGLDDLILLATHQLAAWDVDAIEVCLQVPAGSHLRRWGFVHVGEMHHFVHASPASLLGRPEFATQEVWGLRPGEGESFFS
jgi:hypothetical protein